MHNRNLSEMLPYEKLAVLGIDREKADSLPADVKEKLASGEVTPLLQVSIRAQNGDVITLPLKLQLTTDQQGNPALLAYPVRAALETDRYKALLQLEQKLKDMEKLNDIELGTQQKQQIREGKPIELNVGGEKVSVGVDLKEPQGFKVIQGNLKEWERQQKLRYDEQHPEYLGLVMTDKNRWEYRQVVDKQSQERAVRFGSAKEEKSKSLKR